MLTRLTNFTVAVNDMEGAIDQYRKLFGLELMRPITPPFEWGFRTAYVGNGRDAFIELLEPTEAGSAAARFIRSRGEGVYLVSFDVDDLDAAGRQVRTNGGRVTGIPEDEDPKPDTDVVWVHPATTRGVYIELKRPGAAS